MCMYAHMYMFAHMYAGELADCWFLGAAAAVATKPDLLLSLFVRWDTEYGVFTVRACVQLYGSKRMHIYVSFPQGT